MKWMNKLERKYGKYAVNNLIFYILALNAIVFMLSLMSPGLFDLLVLYRDRLFQGEIWRLLTYLFIPPTYSPFWIIFVLYFYYLIGTGLEQAWGAFRLNLYYVFGMAGTTLAAFITGAGYTGAYLNLSLFFAFAHLYPDFEVLIFFILPVKVKYLAWLNWALFGYSVIFLALPYKIAAVAAVANYFIFFGPDIYRSIKLRQQVQENRRRFISEVRKAQKKR